MKKDEENQFLGNEKISKLLLKFSIPCILSLLISSLYNIVDQIFIGNSKLGYFGNAATSIVFPITIISVAFAWAFGDGSAAYLSICQGRKDTKNANTAIGNSILMSTIVSIIFVVLGFIFMDKLLYLFGATEKTIGLARNYFTILLYFIPFYMFGNVVNSIIRADGSPKYSMLATLIGAITNIILDPIFIFGFDMGIEGAAWATIIGQVLTFIVSLYYMIKKTKTFKLTKTSFHLDKKIFGLVSKLGISTFITQMSIVAISLVCNIMLYTYGAQSKYGADIPIAVIGICMKVFTIVINIVVGIILGAQPVLGYNIGAKKFERVKSTFKLVIGLTVIVSIIATIVFELFPELIIKIFGSESELYMEFAVKTFRIFLSLIICTCSIKVISIFFQAVGEPLKSAVVSLARDIVCFIPLVILLPHFWGVEGVLWAAPIADAIGIIISVILVAVFFRTMKTDEAEKNISQEMKKSQKGIIITIAREHGSQGKYIGELVSQKLNIPYYYKETAALAAKESGLDQDFISKINRKQDILHELYLSTSPVKFAIEAQEIVINKIADEGACVIVGRAADYVLRDRKNLVRIFISAPQNYRIKNIMKMYKDDEETARKNVAKSDKHRADYYKIVAGKEWRELENYDLIIDSSIGAEKTSEVIVDYIEKIQKK